MRKIFPFTIFLIFFATCKKEEKKPECVETLCKKGEAKCFGNYLGICNNDGKKYNLTFCGKDKYCKNGQCNFRGCIPPAKKECFNEEKTILCSEDGASKIDILCTTLEKCIAGECVSKSCSKGKKLCGYNALLTCKEDSSGWNVSPCPEGYSCNKKSLKCEKKVCEPEIAKCIDEKTSAVCNLDGLSEKVTKCGSAEECISGFCMPLVCKIEEDVIVEKEDEVVVFDELIEELIKEDIFIELEEPNVAKVTMDGGTKIPTVDGGSFSNEDVNFTHEKSASYEYKVQKDMFALTLSFTKGLISMEIYIYGIGEKELGKFSCEGGEYETFIWLRAGKYTPAESKDFDYVSISCEITINEFGPVNGRVKGTFQGVLQDAFDNSQIKLTNGFFNVKRKK